jgi:uncharacterized membrane protein
LAQRPDPVKAAEEVAQRGAMIVLTVIVVIAAYLRLHNLAADSVWRDETTSLAQSSGSIFHIITATAQDNYPPLHNFILAITVKLLGDGPFALRLPSAIFGILSVPALYWVGTMVANRVGALIGAFLLAVAPFAIYYSQEARPYALLMLTAILFAGATLAFLQRATRGWAAAVFFSAVALLYTHPYGALTWAAIAAAALVIIVVRPQAGGATAVPWLALQVAIVVAFSPWLVVFFHRAVALEQSGFWIPEPTVPFALAQLQHVAGLTPATVLLVAAATAAFVRPAATDVPSPLARPGPVPLRLGATAPMLLLLAWLVLPIAAALVISLIGTPIFYDRYLIGSLPPLVLLAGIGLSRFVTRFSTGLLVTGFAVIIALLGIVFGMPPAREDWRGLSAYISANLHAGDCVLFVDRDSAQAVEYYLRKPFCELTPRAFATTTASHVIAVRSSNAAALNGALNDPNWHVGKAIDFNVIAVIPMTRSGG